jgi:MFS family permease
LRHRPFDLGLVGLILFVPQLLLAIPAGVLADRVDRKRICIATALLEAAVLAFFALLAHKGVTAPAAYFSAVAVLGVVQATGVPAQRSLLANIVRNEHFVRASAMTSSVAQAITVAGPAIGGLLIAWNTSAALLASGLCFAGSALAYTFLESRPIERADEEELALLATAVEGVRFIFKRKVILGAISLDLFAVLFGGATALLPVFASQILHVGPAGFGLLRAAPGIGAAAVAAFLVRHPIERNAGRWLFWCVAGFGVFTVVFGMSKNFWLSLVALALVGGFDMVSVVIRSALVQLNTPDAMRGRVGAVENVFIGASNELGAFESGAFAQLIGTQASVVLGGCATLVVIAFYALRFPALRRFDRLSGGS